VAKQGSCIHIKLEKGETMKQDKFTDQEKEILLKNPNILKVEGQVTYNPEFKLKAIEEYNKGKFPIQIFIDAGIAVDVLGRPNAGRALKRWKKVFKKQGAMGLLLEQRGKQGKYCSEELSVEERFKRIETKIAYLEAENNFLKKLKASERGLI